MALSGMLARAARVGRRCISTSGRRSDTAAAAATPSAVANPTTETKAAENWVSYGFDYESKTDDENYKHQVFFFSITLALMGGGFYLTYMPDTGRDWASREAFLELRRRELAGLPNIDRNFIDPAKIELPSDEQLGQTDIII